MTSVLKVESTAGERYDSLLDGSKSLVNGLGTILRVASHRASVYDSHLQKRSHIGGFHITTDEQLSRKSRTLSFKSRTSWPYLWARRRERDASDAQLQVKNRSEILRKTKVVHESKPQ